MNTTFEILEGNSLSKLCDYSFGDHLFLADPINLPDSCYKEANAHNLEFLEKAQQFIGKTMTLFIDNIRLYGRPIEVSCENDKLWVEHLMSTNDLMALCYSLPRINFVIFTSHEDTPIDGKIIVHPNVLGIHAVNALHFNSKIHPFPYGLQRKIGTDDHRLEVMKAEVEEDKRIEPSKLLYINCGVGRNKDREPLTKFATNDWVTTRFDKDSKFFPYDKYKTFLNELRDHKFVICPWGHGMDCHRNWESLYMRRVPIMKNHPYFHKLMEGYPVLWVERWEDVTENLLKSCEHLFIQAQDMDLKSLDLKSRFATIMAKYKDNI